MATDFKVRPTVNGSNVVIASDAIATAQIANDAVDNTKLANMAQSTIKGRAAAAGTGDPTDLSVAQVKTILALAAADISDFDTQVRTSTLNQMSAPSADLSINSHKLTSVTDPTSAQDAATKAYVDARNVDANSIIAVQVFS